MGKKSELGDRVSALRINVDALDQITISELDLTIPNMQGKLASLQIYASITDPEGYISPESARQGLKVFGEEYLAESQEKPGSHPSIDGLVRIAERGKPVRADLYRRDSVKMHPFTDDKLMEARERFGTPVIVYDEASILRKIAALNAAFSWVPFMNHIAVKATDCAPIIKIAYDHGMGLDCASFKELKMAEAMGIPGERVILTSNATPAFLYKQAQQMGAIINFDDVSHIRFFRENVGPLPKLAFLRFNPGSRMAGGNKIIGEPGRQKYGCTYDQLIDAIKQLRSEGVEEFGLHQMIVSNELREENIVSAANTMFDVINELTDATGQRFRYANFGGGIGLNYRPEQRPADEKLIGQGIKQGYEERIVGSKNEGLELKMENGRWITGDSAVLLMSALHLEQKPGGAYVKVDASGNDFARIEAYGCYQHLVVVGKTGDLTVYNVAGPKCENSDHWARNRLLPAVERGDLLALCGAGAHGHRMGSGYNGFPQCGEVMLCADGSFKMLTRSESLKDQFAKYDFPGSKFARLAQLE